MNTFGDKIKITVFGESHAEAIGVTVDGLPAGTPVDTNYIQSLLDLRAPGKSDTATRRKEPDKAEFLSGVRNGLTCGGSVIAVIRNTDTRSGDYAALDGKPRPSHADYPAMVKFGSAIDRRGGGQFSGRLTAPLVIAGGIVLPLLERKGIHIAAHIALIGNVRDAAFDPLEDEPELMEKLNRMPFAVIDENAGESMRTCIRACAADGDSIGGTIECKVTGLPAGVGSPMFDGIENALSRAVFARDQHPGLARGHLVDQLADVFDLGRDADDPLGLGGVRPAAAHGRGGRGRLRGRGIVDGAVQRLQQPVHVDGFCEEILRSVAHGLDRRVDRRVGREGYERDACIRNLALRVGQNHVERNPLAQCRGRSLVLDGFGREPFILQPLAQNVSHAF